MREHCLHRCCEQSFAIRAYAVSAVGIDVVNVHKLFAYRVVSAVSTDIVSSHTNTAELHMVSQDSRIHCKVRMNEWPLILWRFNSISTKEWNETRPSHLCLASTNGDFSVICSGLFNKQQQYLVAKRIPSFLWKLYLLRS